MVQEQIVDYINAQIKAGVSRDAIKTTLTGAGWVAADVEDTMKKLESAKVAAPAVSPVSPAPTSRPVVSIASTNPSPQTIKVSDLVSSGVSVQPAVAAKPAASTSAKSPLTGPAMAEPVSLSSSPAKSSNAYPAQSYSANAPRKSHGALITDIVLVIVIVAVGAFAGFLYMQNRSLNTQLSSLNGQSSGVTSQLSSLQAEVAASTTALTAQVASLTTETQELQSELSFYAPPVGATPGATSTVTLSGVVSGGGKAPYVITATYGGKIYVANSKAANVIAAFAPLMATTSTAATAGQFSGTYIPGSDSITLTAVNGTSL